MLRKGLLIYFLQVLSALALFGNPVLAPDPGKPGPNVVWEDSHLVPMFDGRKDVLVQTGTERVPTGTKKVAGIYCHWFKMTQVVGTADFYYLCTSLTCNGYSFTVIGRDKQGDGYVLRTDVNTNFLTAYASHYDNKPDAHWDYYFTHCHY